MSQIVTCPCGCNHSFEIVRDFEKYEIIASEMVGGRMARKGEKGYDVISDDGSTKFQVKYSNVIKSGKYKQWLWHGNLTQNPCDFFILFGIDKQDDFIFLVPVHVAMKRALVRNHTSNDNSQYQIAGQCGYNSWLWDYRVTPINFIRRLAELKSAQQSAMTFSQGLEA